MPADTVDGSRGVVRRIDGVRGFNRFYTRQIGVLREGLLESPYSLAEVRVLYEIAHDEDTNASQLSQALGLDAGYLSRILRKLRDAGLVRSRSSPLDGRVKLLSLTRKGEEVLAGLNVAQDREIETLLKQLSDPEQRRLVAAMSEIEGLLRGRSEPPIPYVLRPPEPGDLGWVVHRHGVLYGREYGWDERFEGLVAEVVATFTRDFDPKRDRGWIAEREGEVVGSVLLVHHPERTGVARLRLLLVEPGARGLGIGRRLVEECTRFARQAGYERITLWTNSVLHAARRIYETEGYELVAEAPHQVFGPGEVGQTWELVL